uniref:Putative secreted protein n=1 Tax=Anopheles marajoara TaxID=58244 RepID=A0A2M4CEK9_9DIPT
MLRILTGLHFFFLLSLLPSLKLNISYPIHRLNDFKQLRISQAICMLHAWCVHDKETKENSQKLETSPPV